MKLVASDLVKTLDPLHFGIPKVPTIAQSDCVIFQGGKAFTFSGDVFAIVSCDIGFQGAVNYDNLVKVLKSYGDEEVDISPISDSVLEIKRGRSHTKVSMASVILLSFSSVANPNPEGWLDLPEKFNEAIVACESVAKVTVGDDVLSSINITSEYMEAASSAQIIRFRCGLQCDQHFLVRTNIVGKLLKCGISKYQVVFSSDTNGWLFLSAGDLKFAIPTRTMDFIDDIDRFIQPGIYSVEFPESLCKEVGIVKAVLGNDEMVSVELQEGVCTLNAVGKGGEHTSSVDMTTPLDIKFSIAPELLLWIVSKYPQCTISDSGIRVCNELFSYAASVEK